MIDLKNREICEFKQEEEDFTSGETPDTINSLWKFVVNFLERIRNGIITTFITHQNFVYVYMDCDQCFHVDVTMERPSLFQPTTDRCLKVSSSGNCSVESVRKRSTHRKSAADIHKDIYGELKHLNLLDVSDNEKGEMVTSANETHDDRPTVCKGNELKDKATSYFEECILRISRITLSDFTASFNKFVRQNGRDFSKSDLTWWFDKFTQYIYLKELFHGEPTQLREQLTFRSIQSKRDSIMQRLYTLREKHELHLPAEEFYKRLKAQSLDPVLKLMKDRQCCGDTNEEKEKRISNTNNLSANSLDKDRGHVIPNKEEMANAPVTTNDLTPVHNTSSEVRAETIDLEQENIQDKVEDSHQQTTSKRRTKREKRRQKRHKSAQEGETKSQTNNTDIQSHFNAESNIDPYDPKHLPTGIDQRKCLNSTIYITRNGFIQISQYKETNSEYKKVSTNGYERKQTFEYYIDYLDAKDPLPPNVEVKPLPPGGLDEVLRDAPPMTKEEMDKYFRVTKAEKKKIHLLREQCEKLDTSAAERREPSDVLEQQTLAAHNENQFVKPRPRKVRTVPKHFLQNPLPFSPLLEAGTQQTLVQNLEKPDSSLPRSVEQHSASTSEPKLKSKNKIALTKQDDTPGIVAEHDAKKMEPGSKMRRFVPATRRTQHQPEIASTEKQSKETTDGQLKEGALPDPKNELPTEQQLFEQLSPLNFIDTDIVNEASNIIQEPVYLETNATIDYSRHVVEPSHGDRPNKKKLQAEIKEKIKTKGEANKHLKAKSERCAYYYDEVNGENVDLDVFDYEEESDQDKSATEQTEECSAASLIVSATDQPQVQDKREFMMVPEEIRRLNDPRLKEIEDKYSIASNNTKKDKKKRKDKKNKVKRSVPLEFVTDVYT